MLQRSNIFRQPYWLVKPPWGPKRIILMYCIFGWFVFVAGSIHPTALYAMIVVVIVCTLILGWCLGTYGYVHRLEQVGYGKDMLEVLDILYVGNRSKNSVRLLRHCRDNFFYTKMYLQSARPINDSAYLNDVRLLYRQYVGNKKRARGLFLGGGCFALPLYISRAYKRSLFDVVECDERIVKLAKKYFFPLFGRGQLKNLRITVGDAYAYTNDSIRRGKTVRYDFIFQDIFVGSKVPPVFSGVKWINALVSLLKPKGLLIMNLGTAQKPHGIARLIHQCQSLRGCTSLSFTSQGTSLVMVVKGGLDSSR